MGYSNFDVNYKTGVPLIYNSGDYKVVSVSELRTDNINGKQLGPSLIAFLIMTLNRDFI